MDCSVKIINNQISIKLLFYTDTCIILIRNIFFVQFCSSWYCSIINNHKASKLKIKYIISHIFSVTDYRSVCMQYHIQTNITGFNAVKSENWQQFSFFSISFDDLFFNSKDVVSHVRAHVMFVFFSKLWNTETIEFNMWIYWL